MQWDFNSNIFLCVFNGFSRQGRCLIAGSSAKNKTLQIWINECVSLASRPVYPQQKEAQTITEQWINEEALSSLNQNLWRTVRREKLKNIKLQSTEHEMLTIYYKKFLLFKYLFIMLSINSYFT